VPGRTVSRAASLAGQALAADRNDCVHLAKGEQPVCTDLASCGYDLTKRRFALILGNTAYSSIAALKTPADDARQLAGILARDHRYEVRCVLNAGRAETKVQLALAAAAVKELARNAGDNPDKARFILYFAGHGFEQGEDTSGYIVPVDAAVDSEDSLRAGSIKVEDLVRDLAAASVAVQPFVIIDACRVPISFNMVVAEASHPAVRIAGAPRRMASAPARRGYAPVFAVARNQEARDDQNRFMRYFAPDTVEPKV
jgi:hypothetical protein